jgi:hypothetical protein
MSDTNEQPADPVAGAAEALGDALAVPDEWPKRATEFVVGAVSTVREKTSGPAISVARAVVYGLLAFFLAIIALVLLVVGVTRLFIVYIPLEVWAVYAIAGAFWTLIGVILWMLRPRHAGTPLPR